MEHIETPSAEEIARHFSACMDSVNLINAGKPEGINDAEWTDCLERNREHLRIMLAKPWWTDQDLQPLRQASVQTLINNQINPPVVQPPLPWNV